MKLPALRQRFGNLAFLEFGWGEWRYCQSESSSLGARLLAILIPSASNLHVVAVTAHPRKFYTEVPIEELSLEDRGFGALLQFIAGSFAIDRQAGLAMQCCGRAVDSQFYAAKGLYHFFDTCNTWSARGLQLAGIELRGR